MASKKPAWASKPRVVGELQRLDLLISQVVSAQRLWEKVLNNDDRRRLGGDWQASYARLGTAGMWRELRGGSPEQNLIEVARRLSFLGQTDYEWLLRAVGEEAASTPTRDHPAWDEAAGVLRWRTRVIRRVRVLAQPSNIHLILAAFEGKGWPDQINNPLRLGQEQLHQALRSLNQGLLRIHFHAQKGGRVITWRRA